MIAVLVIVAVICAFALGWIAHDERQRDRAARRPANVIDLTGARPRRERRPW